MPLAPGGWLIAAQGEGSGDSWGEKGQLLRLTEEQLETDELGSITEWVETGQRSCAFS